MNSKTNRLIGFSFIIALISTVSCTTESTNGNCSNRLAIVSRIVYHRYTTYVTEYSIFCLPIWSWNSCVREITRMKSSTIYVLVNEQEPNCCNGYRQTDDGICVPNCSSGCLHPKVCVSPDQCSCPDGYQGNNCEMAVCNNCQSPKTCAKPDTCVCPSGWNGSNCTEDIDECLDGNGGCDHFCQNTNGSHQCSCQTKFELGLDGLTCLGFLNMTLIMNFTKLEDAPVLILQWEEPSWDVRNLTRGVGINCTDANREIFEIRNMSDYEIILTELNFNVTVTCCSVPITTEGNGHVICEEFSLAEKTETTTLPTERLASTFNHSMSPANNSVMVAGGVSGVLLLLLLTLLIAVLIIVIIKRKKGKQSVKVQSANTSDDYEREYNVEIYGMNDTEESSVLETAFQYDSLKFDNKQIGGLETNKFRENTDAAVIVYESVDNCPVEEYSQLKYNS